MRRLVVKEEEVYIGTICVRNTGPFHKYCTGINSAGKLKALQSIHTNNSIICTQLDALHIYCRFLTYMTVRMPFSSVDEANVLQPLRLP